jgi:hypothetical protein
VTTAAIAADTVVETPTSLHRVDTAVSSDKAEENRWMLAFGLPCLAASLFVAAAIGSGHAWILGLALLSLLTAICMLTWLAISSDTNS